MKYYSEVTKEMYNSEKELVAAERAKAVEEQKKVEVKKANKEELEKLKKAYDQARAEYKEAGEKAEKMLDDARKKYNAARIAYTKEFFKENGTFSYSGYTEDEALDVLANMLNTDFWLF